MTDESMTQRSRAVLSLVMTAALWSTSGLLVKLSDWQPMSILAGRSILAVGVFLIYLRGTHFRLSRVQVVGAVAFLATQALFITATKMTTAANAIFLQYTGPVYVILLAAWWLGERPQRADWLALVVILAGLGFFFGDELSFDGRIGNLLAILSGVTMAVMMVCMRAQKDGTPGQTILISYLMGALVGAPSLIRESFTLQNLAIIGFLGVFQIGLAFALYSSAIKHVHALEATLILTLEPVLNPIWVFLALNERPGPMALLGAALVVGGVTARALVSARTGRAVRARRREVERPEPV